MSRGKDEKGRTALRRIRGPTYSDEEIDTELRDIVAFLETEQSLQESVSYIDCFRGTDRRRTLLCIGITLSQAWSGIAFISR